MAAVQISELSFSYTEGSDILRIKDMVVQAGEIVFLHGPSGCGKTTLLGLLAGVLPCKNGSLRVLDQDMRTLSTFQRDRLRAKSIGYIFQAFNLVPYLNVYENIALPLLFGRGVSSEFSNPRDEIESLTADLGIQNFLKRSVMELSIGQQQRVAAARALMGSPGLILADEPTSALDQDARFGFLDLLFRQARRERAAVLFVSHDRSLAAKFDREISLPAINLALGGGA